MAADNAEKELMIHTHCRRGDREKEEGVREEERVDNAMGDRSGTQKEWRSAKSNDWGLLFKYVPFYRQLYTNISRE